MSSSLAQQLPFALKVSWEMNAGELLVGTATLLLATITAWLARRTSRQVTISEKGLGLTRESIEAFEKPFMIATPDANYTMLGFKEVGPQHPGWRFVYRLWNLGKGPAIVENMSLVDNRGREYLTSSERMERPIAVDPPVFDGLSTLVDNSAPGTNTELTLRIRYRSASGRRYTTVSRVEVTDDLSCICTDFRREEHEFSEAPGIE